jgi:hypothetical protein
VQARVSPPYKRSASATLSATRRKSSTGVSITWPAAFFNKYRRRSTVAAFADKSGFRTLERADGIIGLRMIQHSIIWQSELPRPWAPFCILYLYEPEWLSLGSVLMGSWSGNVPGDEERFDAGAVSFQHDHFIFGKRIIVSEVIDHDIGGT